MHSESATSARRPSRFLSKVTFYVNMTSGLVAHRDSNPGPVFSIPGFGIGEFLSNPGIPAGLWDPGSIRSKTVIIE